MSNSTRQTTDTTVNVTLSAELLKRVQAVIDHMRNEPSVAQAVQEMFEQGLYQLEYRYERNAKQWAKAKEEKEELRQLRQLLKDRQ